MQGTRKVESRLAAAASQSDARTWWLRVYLSDAHIDKSGQERTLVLEDFCRRVLGDQRCGLQLGNWKSKKAIIACRFQPQNLKRSTGKTPPAQIFDVNCRHVGVSHAQWYVTHPGLHTAVKVNWGLP
jgi:hypothetical protein